MKNNELLREEFIEISLDLKKFFEDRDISIGYTDTYFGHLAIYIQDKINQKFDSLKAELVKELEERKQKCGCYNCGIDEAIELVKKL